MTLSGKVALVTGGASGIGRAAALAFAREEAKIIVSDVNTAGGDETVELIRGYGAEASFIPADVSRAAEVEALIKGTVGTFGRLDYAVNNAGISGDMLRRLPEIDEDTFDRIIAINLKGVWLCMKYELPVMQAGGVIVNTASVAGLTGAPKGAAYAASKHGVIGLTRSAALEYAKFGIRINAVCPAYTDTPMVSGVIDSNPEMAQLTLRGIPMKRLGRPEEIADAILWLCSDESSFVTGHALAIDGGLMAM